MTPDSTPLPTLKTLRRSGSFFVLLLAANCAYAQSTASLAAIKQAVATVFPSLQSPGLSVAVAASNEVHWSDGFGLANLERKTPATRATIYRYASISKPISATAVMQLVERGKVSLDAPIQRYVPAFPKKPEGEITVRHLLTHTSGIRHYKDQEFLSHRRYKSVEEALGIFKDDPLEFKPGAKYQYSSYGYNILAAVAEKASGKSFREYLREKIFQPAGMIAADLEVLEEPLTNRCQQYIREADTFVIAPQVDLSCKWAGGGIAGTAEDLVRFCIALDQEKLLQPRMIAQMYQPGVLADGRRTDYGLGWRVRKDKPGRLWVGHSGGATGGTTYLLHNPQGGVAVALLSNAQEVKGLDELAQRLGEMLLEP